LGNLLTDDIFGVRYLLSLSKNVKKDWPTGGRTVPKKNRSFVSAGGKIPWNKKGLDAPGLVQFVHTWGKAAERFFWPVPRRYSYLVPKKFRKKALKAVLTL
jgi:ribosomal protein L4